MMYGYVWPGMDDWQATQHAKAEPPTYTAEAIKARGDGAASALEAVRQIWEAKLGKRLKWQEPSDADPNWKLVDAPELAPTGRVVVTRKGNQ